MLTACIKFLDKPDKSLMSQNWFSWSSSSFFCFKLFRRIRTVNGLSFTTSQLWQHLTQALLSCMAWWSIAGSWYIGTPSQVPAVHYKSGFQEWKKTKKNELMAIHIKRKLPSVLNDSFHWQAKKFMQVYGIWQTLMKDWGLSRQGLQDYSFDNIHVMSCISWLSTGRLKSSCRSMEYDRH